MTDRERTVPLEQSSHAGGGDVHFHQIVDNAATGIAVTSLSHRFMSANAAYCVLPGYTVDELRQRDASMVTLAEDVPEMHRLTQELLAGGRSSYVVERLNRTKAGHLVWLRRSVSVQRDRHGHPVGFVGVVQDISQQKAAEAPLARSQSLLRVASRISRLGAWEPGRWHCQAVRSVGRTRCV